MCVTNVDAARILVLTFTRKATNGMKERIAGLSGISKPVLNTIVAGTFHSVFLRILRSRGYDQRILSNEKFKHITIKNILKNINTRTHMILKLYCHLYPIQKYFCNSRKSSSKNTNRKRN